MSIVHTESTNGYETYSTETETQPEVHDEGVVCPECGGTVQSDDEHAEMVCRDCGLVVEEGGIDRGPEWRAFDGDDRSDRSRVGAPTSNLLHDGGLSSHIGWEDRDSYGNALSPRQRRTMNRLRTWDERFRTRNSKERNLQQALGELQRMGSALGLSDEVRETASVIYRRALAEDMLPGRTIEGMATASLYAAARQMETPRSIDEVSAVSRVEELEFKRAYRYLIRELELPVKPASPQSYVGRLTSTLEVDQETERVARTLLELAEGTAATTGKSPVGLAAAAIYAAANLTGRKLTQEQVGEAADVSTVTIRNRYQELLEVYEASEEAGRLDARPDDGQSSARSTSGSTGTDAHSLATELVR